MGITDKVRQYILQILFPAICLNCKSYLEKEQQGQALCSQCFGEIELVRSQPGLIAIGLYRNAPLQALIHGLKFKHFTHTLVQIEALISRYVKEEYMPDDHYDLITYIPLHPQRKRQRGFNQVELIAKILGKILNLPVVSTLRRVRRTKEQSSIRNTKERLNNVRDCFALGDATAVKNKRIILADDVYTSGATISEAAKVLSQAGVEDIKVFVLANVG